jgi:hypothetical protein
MEYNTSIYVFWAVVKFFFAEGRDGTAGSDPGKNCEGGGASPQQILWHIAAGYGILYPNLAGAPVLRGGGGVRLLKMRAMREL